MYRKVTEKLIDHTILVVSFCVFLTKVFMSLSKLLKLTKKFSRSNKTMLSVISLLTIFLSFLVIKIFQWLHRSLKQLPVGDNDFPTFQKISETVIL